MYTLSAYESMLADDLRVRAYLGAINRVVRPGDVVLEIGTGVGYFAVAACRAGASHVFAIETNDAVQLGPAVAAANGCGDLITFIRRSSERVELLQRADVLIEDLRGVLALSGSRLDVLRDARARLLVPGARSVPLRDTMWAAPCVALDAYRKAVLAPDYAPHGIDVGVLRRYSVNNWYRVRAQRADLLAPPARWATLDLTAPGSSDADGEASWVMASGGTVAGWCVWFDSDLGDEMVLTNAPGAPESIYGQAFFPLEEPWLVEPGDRLHVRFRAKRSEEDYVWAWDSDCERPSRDHLTLRQSSLGGQLLDPARLRARSPLAQPAPTPRTQLYVDLLALVDGRRTLTDIARELHTVHSSLLRNEAEALQFVTARLDFIARDEAL